jgi:hypothetical protein
MRRGETGVGIRGKLMRGALTWAIAGILSAGVSAWTAEAASAQTISVHVVQVRASNEGGEFVDPLLAGLGERLKKQYPGYRNYKRVGSDSESGAPGDALHYTLWGERALTLTLVAVEGDQVSMKMTVVRGRETIVNTSLKVRKGSTFLVAVPLGGDKLILAVTPTVK